MGWLAKQLGYQKKQPPPRSKAQRPLPQPQVVPGLDFLRNTAAQLARHRPVSYRVKGATGVRQVKVLRETYDLDYWPHPTEVVARIPWHHGDSIVLCAACSPRDLVVGDTEPECAVQWWEYTDGK